MKYFIFDIVSSVSGYPTQGIARETKEEVLAEITRQHGDDNIKKLKEVSKEHYDQVVNSW